VKALYHLASAVSMPRDAPTHHRKRRDHSLKKAENAKESVKSSLDVENSACLKPQSDLKGAPLQATIFFRCEVSLGAVCQLLASPYLQSRQGTRSLCEEPHAPRWDRVPSDIFLWYCQYPRSGRNEPFCP